MLEHAKHAVGHQVTAHDVDHGERDGQRSQEHGHPAVGLALSRVAVDPLDARDRLRPVFKALEAR